MVAILKEQYTRNFPKQRNTSGGENMKRLHHVVLIIMVVVALTGITVISEGAWQAVAWEVLKEFVLNLAVDVVTDTAKEHITGEDVNTLKKRIAELEGQVKVHQQNRTYSSAQDLAMVQQTLQSLNNIVNTVDQRLSSVEARLTAIEQNLAVIRQAVQQYTPAPVSQNPGGLRFKINYLFRSGGQGDFKTLTNGGVMRSGDLYKIIVTPEDESYIYIFQVDSSDKIVRLFPMEQFKGVYVNNTNPVRGGVTYFLPARNKSFKLDAQQGGERIYFLASHQRDPVLEFYYQDFLIAQRQDKSAQMLLAQNELVETMEAKGLAAIVPDADIAQTVSWQEAGETFSVLQQRLQGDCQECVHILSFTHQ